MKSSEISDDQFRKLAAKLMLLFGYEKVVLLQVVDSVRWQQTSLFK